MRAPPPRTLAARVRAPPRPARRRTARRRPFHPCACAATSATGSSRGRTRSWFAVLRFGPGCAQTPALDGVGIGRFPLALGERALDMVLGDERVDHLQHGLRD